MYTKQSPPHVQVHRHIATLCAMWVYLHYAPLPLLQGVLFLPVPWAFALGAVIHGERVSVPHLPLFHF